MSNAGERLPFIDAYWFSWMLRRRLLPLTPIAGVPSRGACEEAIVVGSVRRRKRDAGDIEIVVLPRFDPEAVDLFERPVATGAEPTYSALDRVLKAMIDEGLLVPDPGCQGTRQKRFSIGRNFAYPGFKVELYITRPENFGNIVAIRTGPDDFSRPLVTSWAAGGLRPVHLKQDEGRLWYENPITKRRELIPCRTEEQFFRALKLPFVPPKERTTETVAALRAGTYRSNEDVYRAA